MRQYLYLCTSKCVIICTFVCIATGSSSASGGEQEGGGDCHALRGGDFDADAFFFVSEKRGSEELERTRGGAESVFVLSY